MHLCPVAERKRAFSTLRERLITNDPEAVGRVYAAFSERILLIARAHFRDAPPAGVDPEDVLQSVFRSFLSNDAARYDLDDWDGLIELLLRLTHKKCGRVGEGGALDLHPDADDAALRLVDSTPLLEWSLSLDDGPACVRAGIDAVVEPLVESLDLVSQAVLLARLQGYRVPEIAEAVDRTERTVRRKLTTVRGAMEELLEQES